MTKKEALIISAYTGVLMTNMTDFHNYVSKLLGREIFSHELGIASVQEQIKEKSKNDFMALCENF